MDEKLGIIAGSGEIVHFILQKFHREGSKVYLALIEGETSPEVTSLGAESHWFQVSDLNQIIQFFQDKGVQKVFMLGKVRPTSIMGRPAENNSFLSGMLNSLPDRSAKTLISGAINYLASQGLEVGDLTPYLQELLLPPGVVTRRKPTSLEEEDAQYGLFLARQLADLEIGQTIVIKAKTVVAVEAMEGTDETIKRAGLLAGQGTVVVKVGRTDQDNRIDLPVVGKQTIEAMKSAGSTALFIEQGKVAFLKPQKAIEIADQEEMAIKVISFPDQEE